MKKTIKSALVLGVLILLANPLSAQSNSDSESSSGLAFDVKKLVLTFGYGFPNFERNSYKSYYSGNGYKSYSYSGIGPIIAKADYGIVKFKWKHSVGVGIMVGYNATSAKYQYYNKYNFLYTQTDNYSTVTLGVRGTYHFFTTEKVDCYGSVGLGFNINSHNYKSDEPNGYYNTVYYSNNPSTYEALTVGIRYYFTKSFGVYAEAGWDFATPLQAGLAFKF